VTPKMSVIVPALAGHDAVRDVLAALGSQTRREALEIVIVCPTRDDFASRYPHAVIVEVGSLALHHARAAGIRAARAPFVMLAEDHCIPDPGWAEALLPRLDEPWDAIGPTLRSGNPTTLVAQGSFLLGYGEWIAPVRPGPARALPGHNVVLRREALLALGDRLADELLVCALMLKDLGERGARFVVESGATMRHFDSAAWAPSVRVVFCVGSGFGAQRSKPWAPWTRLTYAAAAPALAALHWARSVRQYRRVRRTSRLSPWCLASAGALACAWGAGEAAGALMGVQRVERWVSIGELNKMSYVRPEDRP